MIACSDRLPPQVDGVEPALVVHFDPLYSKKVPIVDLVSLSSRGRRTRVLLRACS